MHRWRGGGVAACGVPTAKSADSKGLVNSEGASALVKLPGVTPGAIMLQTDCLRLSLGRT